MLTQIQIAWFDPTAQEDRARAQCLTILDRVQKTLRHETYDSALDLPMEAAAFACDQELLEEAFALAEKAVAEQAWMKEEKPAIAGSHYALTWQYDDGKQESLYGKDTFPPYGDRLEEAIQRMAELAMDERLDIIFGCNA